MKTIRIQYFAMLRQCAGRSGETRSSEAPALKDLYEELRAEYAFPLPFDRVRAAVDEQYVSMETPLQDGMNVTFIPPVAGG